MSEEEKALSGKWFFPNEPELKAKKSKGHRLSHEFNNLFEEDLEERDAILHELLGSMGEGLRCVGPIFFHYGCHTFIGKDVYCNTNFVCQDDGKVEIGDDCRFGPNCTIVTPTHSLDPEQRRNMANENGVKRFYCLAKPVKIGHDCWFGAGVIVCPGVTIGDNCVIGAGSVVTHDIPDNSLAVGVPCKVLRTIDEKDKIVLF